MFLPRFAVTTILAGALATVCTMPVLAREYPVLKTLGAGKFSNQQVLKDNLTGQPLPNTRYEMYSPDLVIKGVALMPDTETSVIYGTTDAQGRTANVLTSKKLGKNDWSVLRVVGAGDYGNSFYLDNGAGYYSIDVTNGAIYCGKADAMGRTDYLATSNGAKMDFYELDPLSAADLAFCMESVKKTDQLATDADSIAQYEALYDVYHPVATQLSKGLLQITTRKLMDLAVATKDEGRVKIAVDERLKEGADAELLNNVGYDLIDGNVLVAKGLELVTQSLAERPNNFYAEDSKGWALLRLGRVKEAIEWLDKSYRTYQSIGGDDLAALVENYAHRAEAYYQSGDKAEAQRLLNKGYAQDPESELIQQTAERLKLTIGEGDQPVALVPPAAI